MAKYATLQSILSLARTGTVIFADAEYLHGTLALKKRPNPEVWKYAVQIGAVKYSQGKKEGTFQALIRPSPILLSSSTQNPPVNDNGMSLDEEAWKFFEQLTALKRADLESKGRDFAEVWSDFKAFVGK